MMRAFASQTTYGSLSSNATVDAAGGKDCEILGYVIQNSSGSDNLEIELKEYGTSTIIQRVEVDDGASVVMSIPFIADKGVTFDPVGSYASGLTVVVFHKSIGSGVGTSAPRYSFEKTSTTDDFVIASGASIIVYGIALSSAGTTPRLITIKDNDDNVIFPIILQGGRLETIETPFIADNGLKLVKAAADSDVSITVFHSNPGA